MDAIGRKILSSISSNARISLKELAHEVGLSSPATAERLHKMEDSGIIKGYYAQLDEHLLGYGLGVYITIKLRFGQTALFEKEIVKVNEVVECHKLTGQDCMLMKAYVRDATHLEMLNSQLAHYGELNTSLILKTVVEHKAILGSLG